VATTRTEDGHRQNTKTSTVINTERKKEYRETEEEMEVPTSSGGLRIRLTRLNLHEHDDYDDDELASICFGASGAPSSGSPKVIRAKFCVCHLNMELLRRRNM
jgi:hypothetical protein